VILAALLVAAAPCPGLADDGAALKAADEQAFGRVLASVEGRRGGPLLSASESKDPVSEQRTLAAERAGAACRADVAEPAHTAVDLPRLSAILDRPEFEGARRRSRGLEALWNRLWEWLQDLVSLRGTQTFAETTRWIVLILATLAVLFGLARWLRRSPRAKARANAPEPSPAAPLLESPAAHLAQARSALESDPRQAIRQALLALLSVLERRRWARPDRARTNREVAATLEARGAPPEVSLAVRSLCDWYDRAFYSLQAVSPASAAEFVQRVDAFERGLGVSR